MTRAGTPNDDDQRNEAAWVAQQHDVVIAYLERTGIQHRDVGEWPAWHITPHLAIWAIESFSAPGRVGWWAISGDVPTDYVTFGDCDHPREVLSHFARGWAELASYMLRGEPHPETIIGTPDQWPVLGDLLQRRADLLHQYAIDDSLWNHRDA